MAKKRFIGDNLQSSTFTVNSAKPLDDRSVVRTRADLMDNATWVLTENGEPKVYTGMIVSVTNDDTADNNGLYMLRNAAQYTKQSWDSTNANTYDVNGWFKLDTSNFVICHLTSSTINDEEMVYTCDKTVSELRNAYLSNKPVYLSATFGGVDMLFPIAVCVEESVTFGLTCFAPAEAIFSGIIINGMHNTDTNTDSWTVSENYNISLQSDWAQTNPNASDYIKNKPAIPTLLEGVGITLDEDTTNNTITVGTKANHEVISKSQIIQAQHGTILNEYTVRCDLYGSIVKIADKDEFIPDILNNRYPDDIGKYKWTKTASDTGVYAGLCFMSATEGKLIFKLDITDSASNITKEHYFMLLADTPTDSTFTFITTCPWPIEVRMIVNNSRLYGYLQIPDGFVGDIVLTPLRRIITSGSWHGSFDVTTENTLQYYSWGSANNAIQNMGLITTLIGSIPTSEPNTTNYLRTPSGNYNVNIIGDFGGALNIGDKISDSIVNDYFLHTLESKLNNAINENEISTTTQSDWEQNDSNANDYVKNRTHYKEIITGDDANVIFNDTVQMFWLHNMYHTGDTPIPYEKDFNSYKGWWKCTLSHAEDTPVELIGMTMPLEDVGTGVNFFPIDPSFGNDMVFGAAHENTFEVSGIMMAFNDIETFNPFHFNKPNDDSVETDLSLQEQVHVKIEWFPVMYNSRLVQLGFYETSPFESMSDSNSIYALDIFDYMIRIMENKFYISEDTIEPWLMNTGERVLSSEVELKITIGTNTYVSPIQLLNIDGVPVFYAGSMNTNTDGLDPNGQYPFCVGFENNGMYVNLPILVQVKSDTAIDNFSITVNKLSNYHKIPSQYLPQIGNAIVTVNDMNGRQMSLNTIQLNSKGETILRLQTKEFPDNDGNDGDLLSISAGSLQWVSPSSISTNNNLATVATTGDYNDLINTPLPSIYDNSTMTVTDYDGNNYTAVAIGNQVWILQPWKCTHYADGREIPQMPDITQQSTYQGRYMNRLDGGATYSYAAICDIDDLDQTVDPNVRGVANYGWHVPSQSDFQQLIDYLRLHYDPMPGNALTDYGDPTKACPNSYIYMGYKYAGNTKSTIVTMGNDNYKEYSYFIIHSHYSGSTITNIEYEISDNAPSYKYVILVCDSTPQQLGMSPMNDGVLRSKDSVVTWLSPETYQVNVNTTYNGNATLSLLS